MTKAVRILGIDPGTAITGYALIDSDGVASRLLDYGCIKPPPKNTLSARYEIIFDGVSSLIDRFSPIAIAVETQYIHPKNPMSGIKLVMARGVILLAARKKGIEIYEYSPKKAKLALTGNGQASKAQMQVMMQHLFQLKELPQPEDAADALALAFCHAHDRRFPERHGVLL